MAACGQARKGQGKDKGKTEEKTKKNPDLAARVRMMLPTGQTR